MTRAGPSERRAGLEQQQQPGDGDDIVDEDRLADPVREFAIETGRYRAAQKPPTIAMAHSWMATRLPLVGSAQAPATTTVISSTTHAGEDVARPTAPEARRGTSGTATPSAVCTVDRAGGKARNARTMAKARWIERASVSLKTPKPTTKGRGEANQSWNSDQTSAMPAIRRPMKGPALRPPVSACATSSSISAWLSPSCSFALDVSAIISSPIAPHHAALLHNPSKKDPAGKPAGVRRRITSSRVPCSTSRRRHAAARRGRP